LGNATFDNCRFKFVRPASTTGAVTFGLSVTWTTPIQNQIVKFVNCDFVLDSSVQAGDTTNAIDAPNNYKVDNNRIIVEGCRFIGGWDLGIANRGGITEIKNCYIDAVLMINQGSPFGGGGWDMTIDNVVGGPSTTTWLNVVTNDNVEGIFRHKNNLVPEGYNAITTDFGFQDCIYLGGRLIQGASAPTITTPGLRGDRYILNVPSAGNIYEWVCTGYSGPDVVWKAATTLAA
jgi:hypothetical protein